jgi:hypothetical protein
VGSASGGAAFLVTAIGLAAAAMLASYVPPGSTRS